MIHIFTLLLIIGHPKHLAPSTEVIDLWTWKTSQKLVLFPLSAIWSCFQHCERLCRILLPFKAKFGADLLFFKSAIFLGLPKLQVEQHTLVLNKIFLNSHAWYNLIPSRKWLADSTFIHLVIEVCDGGSSSSSVMWLPAHLHHIVSGMAHLLYHSGSNSFLSSMSATLVFMFFPARETSTPISITWPVFKFLRCLQWLLMLYICSVHWSVVVLF